VKTPAEVYEIIDSVCPKLGATGDDFCVVSAVSAVGRVLFEDVIAGENIPGFDRSMVDGYAVIASDTFGCSESNPAVLKPVGEVLMGFGAEFSLKAGECGVVSTGGDIPAGADSVVMVEHTEDFGGGLIGICKPAAPGNNIIYADDDAAFGSILLERGKLLTAHDIGVLAVAGYCEVKVYRKPLVGIISTGDELVGVCGDSRASCDSNNSGASCVSGSSCACGSFGALKQPLLRGQVRDVNTPLLMAVINSSGGESKDYGIYKDDEDLIRSALSKAVSECDIVLISGGSSAGEKDKTASIISSLGEVLFHGIAMKPGKPTIFGLVQNTPVFGLPGHPIASFMITELFVRHTLCHMLNTPFNKKTTIATLTEAISSNHGREEYILVKLVENNCKSDTGNNDNQQRTEIKHKIVTKHQSVAKHQTAAPIKSKSGLITSLTSADGYICIPRNCEGFPKGTEVTVAYF